MVQGRSSVRASCSRFPMRPRRAAPSRDEPEGHDRARDRSARGAHLAGVRRGDGCRARPRPRARRGSLTEPMRVAGRARAPRSPARPLPLPHGRIGGHLGRLRGDRWIALGGRSRVPAARTAHPLADGRWLRTEAVVVPGARSSCAGSRRARSTSAASVRTGAPTRTRRGARVLQAARPRSAAAARAARGSPYHPRGSGSCCSCIAALAGLLVHTDAPRVPTRRRPVDPVPPQLLPLAHEVGHPCVDEAVEPRHLAGAPRSGRARRRSHRRPGRRGRRSRRRPGSSP